MNKVISFAFLAIFVFYGFHRCSQIHPAKYFDRTAEPDPAAAAPQGPPVEPFEASNPFLDPAHAEIRQRLQVRNEAERRSPESPTVTEAEDEARTLPESPAAGEAALMETEAARSVAAFNGPGQAGQSDQPGNPAPPEIPSGFSCRGKVHCGEMGSCEEAEFYLRNCPGTKMDGDGDGKPCEDRCGH
jgi:hypothetical protein